jgi:hypothetical protein
MVALAATAPLVQTWFAAERPGASPYRLYAASNLGSLAGLLAYPFLVERFLGFHAQAWITLVLFACYALLMVLLGRRAPLIGAGADDTATPALPRQRALQVLAASGAGVMLLMAATNHLVLNTAAIPLVWVAPLALYLVTFILVFEGRPFWSDPRAAFGWAVLFAASVLVVRFGAPDTRAWPTVLGAHGLVFFGCLLCHGRLHRLKPEAGALTAYYLMIALGGVLGGLLMAVAAPALLSRPSELGIAALVAARLAMALVAEAPASWRRFAWIPTFAGIGAAGWLLAWQAMQPGVHLRDYYGLLRIGEQEGERVLVNGVTVHGALSLSDPHRPLAYYGPGCGAARALEALRVRKPHLNVGVLGMGIGTLGLYDRPGDAWTFYEISPAVLSAAGPESSWFPILTDMPDRPEILLGDGRTILERERREGRLHRFDLLVVDAFSGDTVPWHLLTREALDLYLDHLDPQGVLAFHISNPLPLERVLLAHARAAGLHGVVHWTPGLPKEGRSTAIGEAAALYLLMARRPEVLQDARITQGSVLRFSPDVFSGHRPDPGGVSALASDRPWTDERSALADLVFRRSAFIH